MPTAVTLQLTVIRGSLPSMLRQFKYRRCDVDALFSCQPNNDRLWCVTWACVRVTSLITSDTERRLHLTQNHGQGLTASIYDICSAGHHYGITRRCFSIFWVNTLHSDVVLTRILRLNISQPCRLRLKRKLFSNT